MKEIRITKEHRVTSKRFSKRELVCGFTLLELIVAIGIFSIVMMIAVGALLSMLNANRKAQALKAVMNNVNFAVENMAKEIRVGTAYHADVIVGAVSSPRDASNVNSFAFEESGGDTVDPNDQVGFRLSQINGKGVIERSDNGALPSSDWSSITSPDVDIEALRFYVYGSDPDDVLQPRTVIVIKGTAMLSNGRQEEFNVQTTVAQRLID